MSVSSRPLLRVIGVLVLLAAGLAALAALRGWPPAPARHNAAATRPSKITARIVRTTLIARQVITGELGYTNPTPLINYRDGAILTRARAPGTIVTRGEPLCWLDGQPVLLLYARQPVWRPFQAGMTDGPDVAALNANLAALGDAPARLTHPDAFRWDTELGLERLQHAAKATVTGTAALGSVVFLPGPVRVGNLAQPLGAQLPAGTTITTLTGSRPAVTLAVDPNTAAHIHTHDPVQVTLPTGAATSGHVAFIDPVATTPSQDNGTPAQPTINLTVAFDQPPRSGITDQAPVEVAITDQRIPHTLAVPVTALLAQPGGGYALATATTPTRLLPVQLGLFDDAAGLVQVTGSDITAGLRVQAAAS